MPSRAIELPMNCSSGISNLGNVFLLAHVVDFCSGWSDSLSLHFHLDDLDLHCIFDLLIHLPFLSGWMLSLRRHLEKFWAVSPPLGSRLAGNLCSQLVHWILS